MDSPVRQYQKQKDYQRHKLFRKIRRRRKAEAQQAIDAPMKELRRRLKRYDDGKNVPMNRSIDGVNLWRDDQTGQYFYQEANGPRIDLTPFNTLGSDDPTTWSFLDAEGKEYNPRRGYVGPTISQTTDAQRIANEVRDIQNTRTWRSDVADQLHNFGDALMWSTMAMNPEGEALMMKASEKLASLGRLAKPMFNKATLAVENYRYPFGRPQIPENFLTIKPQIRTRVGDVEIDNPQLAYRQGEGIVDDFIRKGAVEAATPPESNIVTTREGLTFDFTPQSFDLPMFSQGRPWYGIGKPKSKEMLVTAEPLSKSNSNGGLEPWKYNGTFDVRYDLGKPHTPGWLRRVPDDEQVLNTSNTSAYRWEPGYGYRRVFAEETPTLSWADATRTPQITAENAASMTPEQWTAAQDAAIARGDMAEAQRLSDLHMKTKANSPLLDENGNPLHLYRGDYNGVNPRGGKEVYYRNPNTGYTIYINNSELKPGQHKEGVYLNSDEEYALQYAGLKKNPMNRASTVEEGKTFADFADKNALGDFYVNAESVTKESIPLHYSDIVSKYGYDIQRTKPYDVLEGNVVPHDAPGWYNTTTGKTYVVRDPKNIKLADAVTYDPLTGKRIPLGDRHDFSKNDVLWGLTPFGIGLGTFGALYGTSDSSTFNKGKDSGIHIKPENRGKFTALKKRTGKSASWFKAHGTPAQKKMATFALNARKWKHK